MIPRQLQDKTSDDARSRPFTESLFTIRRLEEAGEAPRAVPRSKNAPLHLRALAEAMKPVRLERLWMVSYPPNFPRDDIFTPQSSARWLKRFDADSDWGGLVDGEPPTRPEASTSAPAHPRASLSAYAGDICPQTGNWQAPRLNYRIEHVERGTPMPGPASTQTGAVVWYWIDGEASH